MLILNNINQCDLFSLLNCRFCPLENLEIPGFEKREWVDLEVNREVDQILATLMDPIAINRHRIERIHLLHRLILHRNHVHLHQNHHLDIEVIRSKKTQRNRNHQHHNVNRTNHHQHRMDHNHHLHLAHHLDHRRNLLK